MRSILPILILTVTFIGCAPRYVVKNQYIPPPDKESKVCLQNCTKKKQRCMLRCANDYSDCLSYAYGDAKRIQKSSEESYKKSYNRYLEELNDYDFKMFAWKNRYKQKHDDWVYFRDRCLKSRDKYGCKREYDLRYVLKKLKQNRPVKPNKPRYITFDEILSKEQQKCSKNCTCGSIYDSCFIGCGGEIIPHKICVENCD